MTSLRIASTRSRTPWVWQGIAVVFPGGSSWRSESGTRHCGNWPSDSWAKRPYGFKQEGSGCWQCAMRRHPGKRISPSMQFHSGTSERQTSGCGERSTPGRGCRLATVSCVRSCDRSGPSRTRSTLSGRGHSHERIRDRRRKQKYQNRDEARGGQERHNDQRRPPWRVGVLGMRHGLTRHARYARQILIVGLDGETLRTGPHGIGTPTSLAPLPLRSLGGPCLQRIP